MIVDREVERPRDEGARAVADEAPDLIDWAGRASHANERMVHRRGDVGRRVDERAIEVEEDRLGTLETRGPHGRDGENRRRGARPEVGARRSLGAPRDPC